MNTGWYAGFGQLETGVSRQIAYPADASRFAGATYDPSGVYRMEAVLGWLDGEKVSPGDIHDHAVSLQRQFLDTVDLPARLVLDDETKRGNFLTFETDAAERLYQQLHSHRVITDYRGKRLRIGFGVYQSSYDVERVAATIRDMTGP